MKLGQTFQVIVNVVWLIFSFILEKDKDRKKDKDELLKDVDKAFDEKDKKKRARDIHNVIDRINRLRT